jgi:hypothetical protein
MGVSFMLVSSTRPLFQIAALAVRISMNFIARPSRQHGRDANAT